MTCSSDQPLEAGIPGAGPEGEACLGPYRIVGELGHGGMGRVYLAEVVGRAPGLDRGSRVAVKVIHPHLLETPGFFKRFLREADIGRTVEHDNVVRCFDCDAILHDGVQQNFLVTEYVEGQTLRDLLEELGTVPEELCRHVGIEVARGLTAIHAAGVVHRDLKPENVLITREHVVKIMDLGVARIQEAAIRLSQTGVFVGSVEYAAPEQFRGGGDDLDGRADLHALGALLYELSTGHHPFRDDDVRVVMRRVIDEERRKVGGRNPQLSPFFEEVVDTLLRREKDERFSTAVELAHALEEGEESHWWRECAKTLRLATQRPLRRIRIPRETALYGRDVDLSQLQDLYAQAKAGDGQVLMIDGEAGIGKTRLVDEFVGRLQREGEDLNFLFGAYPPGGAATAAGAFSTAYREHMGTEGLEDVLPSYLPDSLPLIPAFGALLRGASAPAGSPTLNRESLQTAFVNVTRALARERPTVILIDDLHLAPEEGRAIFAALAAAIPAERVLLIGAFRPGVPDAWLASFGHSAHLARLTLRRLGAKQLGKLLLDTLGSRSVAEELSLLVAEKSDGNPFFVFEILSALRDDGRLERQVDGTWATTEVIEDIGIPTSVLDLVRARIGELEEADQDLLELASCCGYEFDPETVAEASGLDVMVALRRLGRIEHGHRLIRSLGRRCAFDHHQIQEALYQAILAPLRERYHASIARSLERGTPSEMRPVRGAKAVDICEHFFAAGEGRSALDHLPAALDHLEGGYLHDASAALADRALAEPALLSGVPRVRLLMRKAGRLTLLGRRAEERQALDEALVLADDVDAPELRAGVRMALGRHAIQVADAAFALRCYEEATDLARAAGSSRQEVRSTGGMGTACARLGRYDEARAHHERQLELARALGDRNGEAMASGSLGNVAWYVGDYDRARTHFERDAELSQALGDKSGEAASVANLGVIMRGLGHRDEALAYDQRALALFREIGDRRGEAITLSNLGNVHHDRGEFDDALQSHEHAISMCRVIGDAHTEANSHNGIARVLLELRRMEDVSRHVDRQGVLGRSAGSRRLARDARENRALLCSQTGALEEAISLLQDRWTEARQEKDLRSEMATALDLALVFVQVGRAKEAQTLLERCVEIATELHSPETAVLAKVHLAKLGAVDAAAAASELEGEAWRLPHYQRMQAHYLIWEASGIDEHLRTAKQLLDHLVQRVPDAFRASILEDVPLLGDITRAGGERGRGSATTRRRR